VKELLRRTVAERTAIVCVTERVDGDFHPKRVDRDVLHSRQSTITEFPWTMLDQVHGHQTHLVCTQQTIGSDCFSGVAAVGDVLVARHLDTPVAIWAADCAPLVLFGSAGTTVALHAGWRGLASGVIDVGIAELTRLGESVECAVLGPAIHACCYEFGEADLERVAAGVGVCGHAVSGRTSDGRLALDIPAAVEAALARHDVCLDVLDGCTGCDARWFSHRVRCDRERHAVIAWTEVSRESEDQR